MPIISVFVCRCTLHKENASVEAVLSLVRKVYLRNKKSGDRHHCFGLSPDAVCIKSRGGDLSVRLFFDKFHHLVNGSLYAVNVLSARLSEMWLSATAALD